MKDLGTDAYKALDTTAKTAYDAAYATFVKSIDGKPLTANILSAALLTSKDGKKSYLVRLQSPIISSMVLSYELTNSAVRNGIGSTDIGDICPTLHHSIVNGTIEVRYAGDTWTNKGVSGVNTSTTFTFAPGFAVKATDSAMQLNLVAKYTALATIAKQERAELALAMLGEEGE